GADPAAVAIARRELARFGGRVVLVNANFAVLDDVARDHDLLGIDGVLLDLGLSSIQLADDARGFSFRASGPLDMRSDPRLELTAADLVNTWEERDLRRIFAELGEEPEAARVARALVRRRARRPLAAAAELGRW